MKALKPSLLLAAFCSTVCAQISQAEPGSASSQNMQPASLFATLPDSCPTPDAFALAPDGSISLSCVNYAGGKPGVLLSLSASGEVSEIGAIPGVQARPMGLAYGSDGSLYVANNAGPGKGSLLKLTLRDNKVEKVETVAEGMSSPNGLRYRQGKLYLTQLQLPKANSKSMSSAVYVFDENDRNINVASDLSSTKLLFSTQTQNPERQYGIDGLVFDSAGNLYVGDFGDATIYKLQLENGALASHEVFAQLDPSTGIDGISIDSQNNLYVAGFLKNQIFKVSQDGQATLIAEYADNNGSKGEIDQPADLIVWNNKLLVSNFDLMKGKGIVNSGHSKPYTISVIEL
ncbi:SMP-30/gluconolactonase/LRE family protein [Agaribacterium haliotis]|uniref:SMP-30/gluconolactonase/LRE family protein n=1 Tax=Agaribacterium haliotis TaxID=2013869 RepID=UPI000BB59F3D|nr:SMP-30/gluconolactonase/LRE family protein [Agaribacterium haliotis]